MNSTDASTSPVPDIYDEKVVRRFIRDSLGPQRLPLAILIPLTIIYVFIFITGVVGNVMTCVVITRNRFLHTSTNYFLYSLAISDLSLLLLGSTNVVKKATRDMLEALDEAWLQYSEKKDILKYLAAVSVRYNREIGFDNKVFDDD